METMKISEVILRLEAIKREIGDVPVHFMEPMVGDALPMSAEQIESKGDHVEIWPDA